MEVGDRVRLGAGWLEEEEMMEYLLMDRSWALPLVGPDPYISHHFGVCTD